MNGLGPNLQIVLSAVAALEIEHGPGEFSVRAVLDQIWHNHFNLNQGSDDEADLRRHLVQRAAVGDKGALKNLKIVDDKDLRILVRHRATKRRHTARPWARALERINPSRCFRLLEKAQLIDRVRQESSRTIRLTDEGRRLAALHLTDGTRRSTVTLTTTSVMGRVASGS